MSVRFVIGRRSEPVDDDALPTVEEIYAIHEAIVDEYDLDHPGIRAFFPDDKLARVIDRAAERADVFERAAVFLNGLPRVHVFEDGNKRTAWVTAVELLDRNGIEPAPGAEEAARVMKRRQRYDVSELAAWLRTGEIDRDRLG